MEDSVEDDVHALDEDDAHALDHSQYEVLVPAPKPPKVSVAFNNHDVEGNASWLDWERHGACDSHGHYIRCTLCSYIKRVSDDSRSRRLEGVRELKRHYHSKHHKVFPKSSRGMHKWCLPEWGIPDHEIEIFGMYYRQSRHVTGRAAHMRRIPETFWVPNAARAAAYEAWCADPPTIDSVARGQLLDWESELLRRYWIDRSDWDRDVPGIFCLGLLLVWRDLVLSFASYVVDGDAERNAASERSALFWREELRKFDAAFLAVLKAGDAAWERGARVHYQKTVIAKLRTSMSRGVNDDISRPTNVEFCALVLEVKERFAHVDAVLMSRKKKPPGFLEAIQAEERWVRAALKASPLAQIGNPPPRPWTQQEMKAKVGRYVAAYGTKIAEEWKNLGRGEVETWRRRWQAKTIARRMTKIQARYQARAGSSGEAGDDSGRENRCPSGSGQTSLRAEDGASGHECMGSDRDEESDDSLRDFMR